MKKFLWVIFLFLFIAAFGGGFYVYTNLQGVCQKNCQTQVFVVPQGASLNEVLNKLEKEKIIKNARIAKIYLKLKNWNGNIQAGDFKINPASSVDKIIESLQKGTLDFWVTIPEGYRAEQVAERVEQARTNSTSRIPSVSTSPSVIPAQAGIQASSVYLQNEGYLFPDTYLIPKNASDEDIVSIMKNNFENKIDGILRRGGSFDPPHGEGQRPSPTDKLKIINGDLISVQDLIILASLVEREAKNDSERPIIANIIYKRWKADWPLQIDATIQYAIGKSGEWWKKDLTFEDLKVESPFNTYLNNGLPPAPICNPGLKAIEAVINQTQTDFWFYATGTDGVTRFTKTLEGHNQNVEKNINN